MSDRSYDDTGHRDAGKSRGVVLVASKSRVFSDIVGAMVADSGYTPAFAAQHEPVWRSVARTRPSVVICDCDGPVQTLERLAAESAALGIPLLLSTLARDSTSSDIAQLPGVSVLALPASREEFAAALAAAFQSETTSEPAAEDTVSGITGRQRVIPEL
jgi:hypothetical protein